jgi:hypothetical protein
MRTLHEVPEVAQLLATILTGEPVTHGALAVIPLLAPNLDDPDWLTLEEAGEGARITEVSEAGSVPFLRVANGADEPLLLLDGEELIGAKQNRILNTTVLVGAHTEVTIPVSCVEQGRWGYRGRQFRPGDASYRTRHAKLDLTQDPEASQHLPEFPEMDCQNFRTPHPLLSAAGRRQKRSCEAQGATTRRGRCAGEVGAGDRCRR